MKDEKRTVGIVLFLAVLLLCLAFASLGIGAAHIGYGKILETVHEGIFGASPVLAPHQEAVHDVVWILRMPRVLLAVCAGAGLAVSGVVMQAAVKNPLADPYILGVSSGASLGAALAILLGVGAWLESAAVGVAAFVGAFGIAMLALLIANIGGMASPLRLLLAGMALSTACSALSGFLIYFAGDRDGIQSITLWLMGSFAGARWETMPAVFLSVVVGCGFFLTQSRVLDMMLLGDEEAVTLGRRLSSYRQGYLAMVALMVGFLVYAAGMIGFIGLIVPHVARHFVGATHRSLLPVSALLGACLALLSDALARGLLPHTEIPVGLIISVVGAPSFVYLMVRRSARRSRGGV